MTLGRKTRVNRNSEIRIGSSRNSFQTIILYLSGTQDFSRSLVYRTSDFAPSPRRQIKTTALSRDFYLAGAGGIEPTLTVLETVVLPLYDAPVVI